MSFMKTNDAPAIPVRSTLDFDRYIMSKTQWDRLSDEEQEQLIQEVFEFYRTEWGFPYPMKTENIRGERTEAIKAGIERDYIKYAKQAYRLRRFDSQSLQVGYDPEMEEIEGGGLFVDDTEPSRELKQNLTGIGTANAFMHHLHHTPVKGMMSPFEGFNDDKKFRKAIRLALRWDNNGALPVGIRYGLRSIGGIQSVGNFKPTVARFLYDRYTPDTGGIVYDYSCGWGGRLLGARSSKKNIMYVGVDPSVKTFKCLLRFDKFLCRLYTYWPSLDDHYEVGKLFRLKSGHLQYRSDLVRITCIGSEDFCPEDLQGKVDFAFSSPPYFDLEDYAQGDEGYENQSHVKFPGRDGWLHGFLKGTADNIAALVKSGGTVGLNLADFRDTELTAEAVAVYESAGLVYTPDENYEMRISVRTGNRKIEKNLTDKGERKKHKTEPIFIFKKP